MINEHILPHIYYIAFDPGKSTGWVVWDKDGKPLDYGTSENKEDLVTLLQQLSDIPPKVVICEDFRLFSHLATQQSDSDMPASIAIGYIENTVFHWKAKLIKQHSNIKPIAQLWTDKKPKSKGDPNRHWIDAYNHGEYYMIKNGIKEIKL